VFVSRGVILTRLNQCKNPAGTLLNVSWKFPGNLLGWICRQACREPQRGPGNHYHRALSQSHSECAEIEMPIRRRGGGNVESVSPHHPTRGLGERAPAENGFYAYLRSERRHLEHLLQYFWMLAGPRSSNVAGPGKLSPFLPLSTGLFVDNL